MTITVRIDNLTVHVDAKSGIPPVFQTLLEKLMTLPEDLAAAVAAAKAESATLNSKVDAFIVTAGTTKDALLAALANVTDPAAVAAMQAAIADLNAMTDSAKSEEVKVDTANTADAP